ncbi:MAG: 2-oxoacid:acceptor oxidoreductase subunit alpha [Acidobacteria bacterium]|nr:2-oxoacid:acceptor oxidoreductase subunit alpha [Acidobacteriota bacterium]MBV9476552.1 2-oxoacid:acceptor oxidoreductase subunit alpha [Acidobacteriota bacterium]
MSTSQRHKETNVSETLIAADPAEAVGAGAEPIVNDLTIHVATVNGSGSQSSNNVLMRSIFQMGVPVSGKNMFPSNIAGLPTWFTIRANKDGWIGRKKEVDLMVCMNAQTAREDVDALQPGALCIYDAPLNCKTFRNDIHFFEVPFAKLAADLAEDSKLRKLLTNMIYVGIVAELIGIDRAEIVTAITKQFKGKKKAIDPNVAAIDKGFAYAQANLPRQNRWRIERMHATEGKIIIDGNAAAAIGAMFGGVTVVTWYPITPSSSLCESLIDYMKEYRIEEDGKATFAIVQAEDELAAIGMVLGAGWAGARSMTSTAGPGVSLMAEFIGLGYFAELPGVIWDIQRVGPSTGLPTRTAQGDVNQVAYLSHGDTQHIVLIPSSVGECFEFASEALDLAEEFQTPIFVLSDLDLGMNNWMSDPFPYPTKPIKRGKVLNAERLTELQGKWGRYADVDGDGIAWRTLPGTDHPFASYFTRGSGHDAQGRYSEKPQDYKDTVDRLAKKYETAKLFVPQPVVDRRENAKIGFIAYGTTTWALEESRDQLRRERGIETSYFRLRALPFTDELNAFIAAHDRVYIVEQNRDGQMGDMIRLAAGEDQRKLRKILHYTGLPCDARTITDAVLQMESTIELPEPLLLVRAEARLTGSAVAFVPGAVPQREVRVED